MAKTASVFLEGEISYYSYMASIQGVREQLTWQGQFDEIQVTINSCGGDMAEGLGIYDLLRSYGVPITTVVIGQCCSAATIVFLAGNKARLIYENVVAFMVHQASGGGEGTADELRTIADFIDSYNERMAAIYIEVTGLDAEAVAELMSKDSFMTAEEAVANSFATSIAKPVQAKYSCRPPAKPPISVAASAEATPPASTPSTQSISESTMKILKDKWSRVSASVTALLNGKTIVARKVTTDSGEELDIETVDGGDNYAEGDVVRKGSDPAPDGSYRVGNVTIVVKDGKIESLTSEESVDTTASNETTVTASGDDGAELETLRQENATLQQEKTALEGRVTAMESTIGTVNAKMKILLGSRESADLNIPAGNKTTKPVSARAKVESDEETERQAMLEERKNRGLGKTAESK
ncbi:Clp protease ClpP [Spirosoma fluminis]